MPSDAETPDIPGQGRYEVWHTTDSMARIAAMRFGAPISEFPAGYTLVGVVEADGLDSAFELTITTDSAWIDKPGVVQARLEDMDSGTRSTSIGDVLVAPDGTPYRVGKAGFAEAERACLIDATGPDRSDPEMDRPFEAEEGRDIKVLAAEQKIDDEAARLRDRCGDCQAFFDVYAAWGTDDKDRGIER